MATNTLLIDAGNTRLKWALLESGQLSPSTSFVHRGTAFATQLSEHWGPLKTLNDAPGRVLLANVAGPELAQSVLDWCEHEWGLEAEQVVARAEAYGVTNIYRQPAQLGVDRWLGLVAARRHVDGATCIIDCGTAITVDVLDAAGRHRGGIIVPGLEMMRNGLVSNTGISNEHWEDEMSKVSWLGNDTRSGVAAGAMCAAVGVVDQVVRRSQQELDVELQCVVTGGDAEVLVRYWDDNVRLEPDWVLKGLAIVAEGEL